MRRILLTLVAAVSIAAATLAAPKPAEARCYGCWVGAGVAASVIAGAAIANAGYYGAPAYYSGYGPYQPAYYYGGYRPYYGYYAPRYYAPRYYAPYGGYGYYAPRYYAPRYGYGYYRPYGRYGYRW